MNILQINTDNSVSKVLALITDDIEQLVQENGWVVYEKELPNSDYLLWDNGIVVIDTTKELISVKSAALHSIINKHAELLRLLTGNATIEERDTWQTKAIAAEAFNNNSASNSQKLMLQSEADILDFDVSILAQTILQKYESYQKLIGLASGLRSKGKKLVEACSTKEEVKTVMEQLEQEMNTYITQLNG